MQSLSPTETLQAQRVVLQKRLVEFRTEHEANALAFREALNAIHNLCGQLDTAVRVHCNQTGLAQRSEQLRTDLEQLGTIPPDQPLRRKADGRIVALQSRSALKRWTGIGAKARAAQAADLCERHRLGGTVVTPQVLKTTHAAVDACMADHALAHLRQHATALRQGIAKAAGLATFQHKAEADNHQYAKHAVERLQQRYPFSAGLAAVCKELDADRARALGDRLAPVQGSLSRLDAQLRDAERQQRLQQRAALLAGCGVAVPATPDTGLGPRLQALRAQTRFDDIYHTTTGCTALQGMLEDRASRVEGSKVIEEIRRVHGQEAFDRGMAPEKAALKAAAAALTPRTARQLNDLFHALALAEYRQGTRDYRIGYRQADHSAAMIGRLRAMVGSHRLLQPTRLLSTADDRAGIGAFPVKREPGLARVQFTIDGFSGIRTGSRWRVLGEGQERVYSTHSRFRVLAVQQDAAGTWHVQLREQPVNAGHAGDVPLTR